MATTSLNRLLLGAALLLAHTPALAERTLEDCQNAWGQAARSYAPAKKNQALQDEVFKPACEAATSDKAKGRLEALVVAARGLQKADPDGCKRFMQYYVAAKDPQAVCDAAAGDDEQALRDAISANLPAAKAKK